MKLDVKKIYSIIEEIREFTTNPIFLIEKLKELDKATQGNYDDISHEEYIAAMNSIKVRNMTEELIGYMENFWKRYDDYISVINSVD